MGTVLVTFREMRFLFVACLAVTVSAAPQANFGKKIEVNERLGLLANDLGLDPTAETSQSAALTAETSAGASGQLPSGRVPGGEEIGEPAGESQCCCVPQDEQCDDPFAGEDLVGLGLIDPRKKPLNSINTRILKHPQMSNTRLSNDLAILYVDRDINLNHPYVNTACLPSCADQFDHQFSNGTGVRCFVAGWGKDEHDGSFQFIPKKVDLPLVNDDQCEASLQTALNAQRPGAGDRFRIHPSEICAGAEVGKDACTGDGGSPLVCQAKSGRWTVMGLVAWGVGCASDLPGVYVRMSYFKDWIDAN